MPEMNGEEESGLPAENAGQVPQNAQTVKRLGLRFSMKRQRLTICMGTLEILGDPDYIRLLINKKLKQIAVQTCEMIDRDCYHVPWKEVEKQNRFDIASVKLLGLVYKISDWDQEKSYRIQGYLVKDYRLVLFLLDEAEEISEDDLDEEP